MKAKEYLILLALLVSTGCTLSSTQNIVLKGNLDPGQISLDKKVPVSIEASVENIGNSTETVTVDVDDTEGLLIDKPERLSFTLKPGESRVLIFKGALEETSLPGKYRIEINAESNSGGEVREVVFLNVVTGRGFI